MTESQAENARAAGSGQPEKAPNSGLAKPARTRVLIEGRVQGIFFRAYARDQAAQLKLAGWVRNLPDGSVEALVEGPIDRVEAFINWCHSGPPNARVTAVKIERQEYRGEFQTFSVRY